MPLASPWCVSSIVRSAWLPPSSSTTWRATACRSPRLRAHGDAAAELAPACSRAGRRSSATPAARPTGSASRTCVRVDPVEAGALEQQDRTHQDRGDRVAQVVAHDADQPLAELAALRRAGSSRARPPPGRRAPTAATRAPRCASTPSSSATARRPVTSPPTTSGTPRKRSGRHAEQPWSRCDERARRAARGTRAVSSRSRPNDARTDSTPSSLHRA